MDESRVSELRGELTEAQDEAAAAKEELSSCRERLEKLQDLLQVQTLAPSNQIQGVCGRASHTAHSNIGKCVI